MSNIIFGIKSISQRVSKLWMFELIPRNDKHYFKKKKKNGLKNNYYASIMYVMGF